MKKQVFEKQIKSAVHELCEAIAAWDASSLLINAPSAAFISKAQRLFDCYERKKRRRKALKTVAACFVALILTFAMACLASPRVWAAVKNWFVQIVSPVDRYYEFSHPNNDHAFPVVKPAALPEGMELTDLIKGEGYNKQTYTNVKTGRYLKFDYHWSTSKERNKLDKLLEKFGATVIHRGNRAAVYSEKGVNKLVWYDIYTELIFCAESDLSEDELIKVFADSIEMHPQIYEPTWLPEGYVFYESYLEIGVSGVLYQNAETNDLIVIEVSDLGWNDRMFVLGEGGSVSTTINGVPADVYCHEDSFRGTDLICINEKNKLVITIETRLIDADMVVRIAEKLVTVQGFTRFMP